MRGYIINSRIRSAENLMIARPYNPALFRLGPPAGPHYLLQVLRGTLSRQEAVRQWDAAEKRREEVRSQTQEAKWPFSMRLPCRMCSDPNNESTFKPMQAYVPSRQPRRCSTADEFGEVWMECIAFGADLICWRCRHELGHEDSERQCRRYIEEQLIFCDDCCTIKLASDFSQDM